MQRLLAALAIALMMAIAYTAPVIADDDDEGFTPITDCGTVIDQPGNYRLANDLVLCATPSPDPNLPIVAGVIIASDDVVLDMDGHTISCDLGAPFFSFGVLSDFQNAGVKIMDGTVTNCLIGVEMSGNHNGVVRDMKIVANVFGMEVIAGSKVKVKNNEITGNFEIGVVATSFFFGGYVGPGLGHKFQRNLMADNGFFAMIANGLVESDISCNRMDRNYGGLQLESPGTDNTIRKNVATDNLEVGIAAVGIIGEDFVQPVPAGNTFKRNIALGNGADDLAEVSIVIPSDPLEFVFPEACQNMWKNNHYVTSNALEGCIPPPRYFDDDDDSDICAPGFDHDDDSDSDSDSDSN